jgi:hypothetical protein
VAQFAANQRREALASARLTQTELVRRGLAVFPALVLVEAVAFYRSGAGREADRLAAQVEAGGDPAAAARAAFLRGLIADEAGNQVELERPWRGLRISLPPRRARMPMNSQHGVTSGPAYSQLRRAGESAAAQGDAGRARRWVHQAVALDDSPTLRRAAGRTLPQPARQWRARGE